MSTKNQKMSIETTVLAGLLTAIVIVLQMLGSFIRLGPFQICLVLLPIVIGAATCGTGVSTWLGFVFGLVVLLNGDAAPFLAIDVFGTIITVMLKGIASGLAAGLIYKLFSKINRYFAVVAAALVCPFVNTGIFLLGCRIFFFAAIKDWGIADGFDNAVQYMFLGLVGGNFLVELGSNILLSPVIVRLINVRQVNN